MYQTFWNYQQKKSGEIVIAKEEIQKMLDQAYQAGYNQAFVEQHQMVMESARITGEERSDESSLDGSLKNEPVIPMMPLQLPDADDLMSDLDL